MDNKYYWFTKLLTGELTDGQVKRLHRREANDGKPRSTTQLANRGRQSAECSQRLSTAPVGEQGRDSAAPYPDKL